MNDVHQQSRGINGRGKWLLKKIRLGLLKKMRRIQKIKEWCLVPTRIATCDYKDPQEGNELKICEVQTKWKTTQNNKLVDSLVDSNLKLMSKYEIFSDP